MDAPSFAAVFGRGHWDGVMYVLDTCPMCAGKHTMRFTGKGQWGCSSCHKGGQTLDTLKKHLESDDMMNHYAQGLVMPERPDGLIVVSEYKQDAKAQLFGTGFEAIDKTLSGIPQGLTVMTGKRGEGKSTFLGQIALNVINGHKDVCFYSGELSAYRFQRWLFSQAAGQKNLEPYTDAFGATRYDINATAEKRIREWMGDKLVLYDNKTTSDRKKILDTFRRAREYYGSSLFVVDNLMTARYDIDDERDALRAQASFANACLDFANTEEVSLILVAHPKKGDHGDINDSVAGLGDITNMASAVMQMRKATDLEIANEGFDAALTIAKNREHGEVGQIKFTFDKNSRRFIPKNGYTVTRYGWG